MEIREARDRKQALGPRKRERERESTTRVLRDERGTEEIATKSKSGE